MTDRKAGASATGTGVRALFAERFALLYVTAGDPPLKRVADAVERARRLDERGRPIRSTAQRISDWRRGRNVPARFAALSVVLEILIGEARKTNRNLRWKDCTTCRPGGPVGKKRSPAR